MRSDAFTVQAQETPAAAARPVPVPVAAGGRRARPPGDYIPLSVNGVVIDNLQNASGTASSKISHEICSQEQGDVWEKLRAKHAEIQAESTQKKLVRLKLLIFTIYGGYGDPHHVETQWLVSGKVEHPVTGKKIILPDYDEVVELRNEIKAIKLKAKRDQKRKNNAVVNKIPDAIEIYPTDVRIVRHSDEQPEQLKNKKRGKVERLSPHSKLALGRTARNAFPALISHFLLTYHKTSPNGEESKKQLDRFLNSLRYHCPEAKNLWTMEFHKSGKLHFHVWLTVKPTEELHKKLGKAWNRIAEPGNQQHLDFHTQKRVNKYGQEESAFIDWDMTTGNYPEKLHDDAQKNVPEDFGWTGRMWGASRNLVPDPIVITKEEIGEHQMTEIVRTCSKWRENVRRKALKAAQLRAKRANKRHKSLKLNRTARSVNNSAWINYGSPVLLHLIERLNI